MAENSRQRQAFEKYWHLGAGRSVEQLHRVLSEQGKAPNLRTLYEWSRRHHWQSRIAELERQAAAVADEARVQALKEMYERQAREGLLLQQKGAEWLSGLRSGEVNAEAAIRAVVEGAKLERLARGEPGEREEISNAGEDTRLHDLSDAELERLIAYTEGGVVGASETQTGGPLRLGDGAQDDRG